jgi:hypothetical protein
MLLLNTDYLYVSSNNLRINNGNSKIFISKGRQYHPGSDSLQTVEFKYY